MRKNKYKSLVKKKALSKGHFFFFWTMKFLDKGLPCFSSRSRLSISLTSKKTVIGSSGSEMSEGTKNRKRKRKRDSSTHYHKQLQKGTNRVTEEGDG